LNYSFKRSSEIYIVRDGVGYHCSTLSNFTLSQTISEKTVSRKSQFKNIAAKRVINRKRNVGTGSIEFYYTNNDPGLSILMSSLDFVPNYNRGFTFKNEFSSRPTPVSLYIVDRLSGKRINLPKVYITNMDVRLSPANMTKIVFGFSYPESDEGNSTVFTQRGLTPVYPAPMYIDFSIGANQINSVKSAAFTITRDLSWTSEGANQFNLGEVTHVSNPVVTDYNITALATANDNIDPNITKHLLPNDQDVVIGNSAFYLKIPKARITTRKNPEEVFTVSFDIKHQSLLPVLLGGTYNGHIN
jgi:hypothetical protein